MYSSYPCKSLLPRPGSCSFALYYHYRRRCIVACILRACYNHFVTKTRARLALNVTNNSQTAKHIHLKKHPSRLKSYNKKQCGQLLLDHIVFLFAVAYLLFFACSMRLLASSVLCLAFAICCSLSFCIFSFL